MAGYITHETGENNFYVSTFSDNRNNTSEYDSYQEWTIGKDSNIGQFQHVPNFQPFDAPTGNSNDFDDEPPLLEELGVDIERIIEKTLTVLNPFRKEGPIDDAKYLVQDADLAGPLLFCITLGTCLVLSGGCNFGYVYVIALIGCISVYILLNLMATYSEYITITSVTSVLGYCLLPMVVLCAAGIFIPLQSFGGIVLTITSVMWCSYAASRLLAALAMDNGQKLLFAYSCCLLYSAFALLAIF